MRRIPSLLAGAGLAAALSAGFGASSADALTPSQAGWWSAANPGSVMGSPTLSPPSDVPTKGLLIEGSPSSTAGAADSGPTAFGAVVYDIPFGATVGALTLSVAPNSATTPSATLEMCPLTNPFIQSEYGGPTSDAPAFDCAKYVTANPSSSGNSYTFNVANLVSDGNLALAILPTSVIDRVVLAAPSETSLPIKGQVVQTTPTTLAGGGFSGGTGGTTAVTLPPPAGAALTPATAGSNAAISAPPIAPGPTPAATGAVSPSFANQSTPLTTVTQQGSAPAQFAAITASPSKAKPLVVGVLIGAVVVGGGVWIAVGRAAARAAVEPTTDLTVGGV